ncbi:MAG: carbohydrate-binding protein [Luteolibacter sp.]
MIRSFLIPTALLSGLAMAAEFHVSPSGSDANAGTPAAMLKTISEAANRAQPGDTVTVHEGTYRERIDPPRGGTSDTARITYQAAPGESVTIKGSETATGWTLVGNDTWKVTLPNSAFGNFNPYNTLISGDWFTSNGRNHHTGAVYLNGDWLTESATKATVLAAAGGSPLWFAEVEGGGSLLNMGWLQPYAGATAGTRLDASYFDRDLGVMIAANSEGGECVGFIDDGEWTRYDTVNFGSQADSLKIRAASGATGAIVQARLDGPGGVLLGTVTVSNTGGWQTWQTFGIPITPTSGVHRVCLVYRAPNYATATTTIWAQFPGKNPNNENVEMNARQTVFYPDEPGLDFITVRGFTLEHAATPWSPPTAEQIGLIGTNWGYRWVIENNTVRYSVCSGISLGKYGDRWDNTATTTANSSNAYVETINRALANGWHKGETGSHLVRGNTISHCEQAGIVGSLGGAFSVIEDNEIHDIHVRALFDGAEMAGIKLHGAIDVQVVGNHIHHVCRGIWLDWMAQGTRVSRCLMHDNAPDEDIFLEVDHGPVLMDHNVFLSTKAIWDSSQGEAYAHNLIAGTIQFSPDQNGRDTPYMVAHDTAITGYTKIQGGDTRYYNNILVGPASLAGYNNAVRPVAMDGNVFLKGAAASNRETSPLVLSSFDPLIQLRAGATGTFLEVTADSAWGSARNRPLVTTSLLGSAAVPAVPFEQPDGSPWLLDKDFAGIQRAASPFPGPFEQVFTGANVWKISTAATDPVPVPVTGPQRVHVDINGGQTAGTAGDFSGTPATVLGAEGETWNTATPGNKTSGTSTGLRNASGATTTLNLGWSANHWSYDNSTAAGSYRDLLGDYAYIYNGSGGQPSSTWTLGGLGANATCSLVIYAATGTSGGKWTVNGTAKEATASTSVASLTEGVNYVRFDNLRASRSGEIVIGFSIRSGSSFGEMAGLEIETSGTTEAPPISATAPRLHDGVFDLTGTGLDTSRRYVLTRSADLRDGFRTVVGPAFTPVAANVILTDNSPPPDRAFYRIEELP